MKNKSKKSLIAINHALNAYKTETDSAMYNK